jgi:3-oxoacyl-[acyl-carrier protein] reductase
MKRTILILGASGFIGSAVANAVAAPNVNLALHWRKNQAPIEVLLQTLKQQECFGLAYQSDLSSTEDCDQLVDRVLNKFGRIDGLAICSGTVGWMHWSELSYENWNQMFFEHCVVPMRIASRIIPVFERQRYGRIAYLSSISSKYGGSPASMHYAAAKSALEAAMYGLSRMVAGSGVCINGIRAGFVDTPQQHAGRTVNAIKERITKIPMGRAGSPQEIAAAFKLFLSSDVGFITGEILAVAGGD